MCIYSESKRIFFGDSLFLLDCSHCSFMHRFVFHVFICLFNLYKHIYVYDSSFDFFLFLYLLQSSKFEGDH